LPRAEPDLRYIHARITKWTKLHHILLFQVEWISDKI
jgi:hypothetical protein